MKRNIVFWILGLFSCVNGMAFGPARVQLPPQLTDFTALDQRGHSALIEITSVNWARNKAVTIEDSFNFFARVMITQTASVSFDGKTLLIYSSAGGSRTDGTIFTGLTDSYSSSTFDTPINYTGQKILEDGTVQIAIGVDYIRGAAVDKNQNKISVATLHEALFSLPSTLPSNQFADVGRAGVFNLTQFIVLSITHDKLVLSGISDATGASTYTTTYAR